MDWDPRLTDLGVGVNVNSTAAWKLVSAQYQDETQSGGNHNIYFAVKDGAGNPVAGATCVVDWVGRESSDHPTTMRTDPGGAANFPMYANLDLTLKNGPYFAYIGDQSQSDVLYGMGLPEQRHVNFLLTFAAATSSGTPSDPQVTLEQAVITIAKLYSWLPINTDGALFKFAAANNLGFPQTDEFEFAFGGDIYIGQVYNLGIVYAKKGDWKNVKWVKKPA
ncbi:MAG: hypothetical protein M1570_12770 [Chloroflexi bacterium]|nr:hypothetical protein [Chloroflexota bacterium]